MGVVCKLNNIVICIKYNFSRWYVMKAVFDLGFSKCEEEIEFASLSIARVHIAICVIAIFRVIKRNYLDLEVHLAEVHPCWLIEGGGDECSLV